MNRQPWGGREGACGGTRGHSVQRVRGLWQFGHERKSDLPRGSQETKASEAMKERRAVHSGHSQGTWCRQSLLVLGKAGCGVGGRKPGMRGWRSEYKVSKGRRERKDSRWRKLVGRRSWERLYRTLLGRFKKTKARAAWGLVGVLMGVHLLYKVPWTPWKKKLLRVGLKQLLPHILAEKEIIWLESRKP